MELRVLNYFLMVAREENITKAAQLLHVTQPTLSRQLMQLEEELGVKLFKRSNHSIVLTDEGMLLKRRAHELVQLAEITKRELAGGEALSGAIAIGAVSFIVLLCWHPSWRIFRRVIHWSVMRFTAAMPIILMTA